MLDAEILRIGAVTLLLSAEVQVALMFSRSSWKTKSTEKMSTSLEEEMVCQCQCTLGVYHVSKLIMITSVPQLPHYHHSIID